MKKLIIILFILFAIKCDTQNLVPNGSFEQYSNCPNGGGSINYALPWFNPTSCTPDYMNACNTLNNVSVPFNYCGYQDAKTGNAYCNILTYTGYYNFNLREYIEVELEQPLLSGNNYCVKFYVNLCDSNQYAIREIGAYFSDVAIYRSDALNFTYTPQVFYNAGVFLNDKTNWVEISGSFVASSNNKYITIGNFKNDANTDSLFVGGGNNWKQSSFYIDDVSVYECDAPVYTAEAGSSQTVCTNNNDSVQIGTTPQSEYIYWWLPATGLSDDSIANPKARPAVTTTYYLHQKDFKFDETIDSVTVVVEDCPANNLIIVNAFTPNSDGINDVFHIKGTNIKELHAKIINRWGQVLYKWDDALGGWDGKYNNMYVGAGAYFWVATVVYEDGSVEERKGALELIR